MMARSGLRSMLVVFGVVRKTRRFSLLETLKMSGRVVMGYEH
jgi:hypothetical protein